MTTEVNEKSIAAAAQSVDKASVSTAATDGDEPKTATGMLAAMKKHSGGTNVLKESIKVCEKSRCCSFRDYS